MYVFVIMMSSGCYDDYSNDVAFLVDSERDAKEICKFYNDYVVYQQDVDKKVAAYRIAWTQENPNTFTHSIEKRHRQVKDLLTRGFKKEQEDKLIEELNELATQRKASIEWANQSWEATMAFKKTIVTPKKFDKIKDSVTSDAHYSYFEMQISDKRDIL